jgi:hypothetical protein
MLVDLERDLNAFLIFFRSDLDGCCRFISKEPVELAQFLLNALLQLIAYLHTFAVNVDLHDDRSLLNRSLLLSRLRISILI